MLMDGCQGKPRTPTIHEKICPKCGNIIELFSIDTQVPCEHCGFVAYNDIYFVYTCIFTCITNIIYCTSIIYFMKNFR